MRIWSQWSREEKDALNARWSSMSDDDKLAFARQQDELADFERIERSMEKMAEALKDLVESGWRTPHGG